MPNRLFAAYVWRDVNMHQKDKLWVGDLKNYLGKRLLREMDKNCQQSSAMHVMPWRQFSTTIWHVAEELLKASVLSPKTIQLKIPLTPRSHKYCIVCKKTGNHARTQAFIKKGVFINSKNKCYIKHIFILFFLNQNCQWFVWQNHLFFQGRTCFLTWKYMQYDENKVILTLTFHQWWQVMITTGVCYNSLLWLCKLKKTSRKCQW